MNQNRIGTLAERRNDAARLQTKTITPPGEVLMKLARAAALLGMSALALVLGWAFLVGLFSITP